MDKAIVTGAGGFIGSWLVKELAARGIEVWAVVHQREVQYAWDGLPHIKVIFGEMADAAALAGKLSGCGATVFYHLAWDGSTGAARAEPDRQLRNAWWAVEAARLAGTLGCRRFISAGSPAEAECSAYAALDGSQPRMESCYGAAKLAAHYMTKAECSRQGIEHIWARLPNTYGEGNHTGNFINFAAQLLLTGQRASFTSGEQLYDFLYAPDVAWALYLLGISGQPFCSYYIGSGRPRPLKEFIYELRDAIDASLPLYLGEVAYQGIMPGVDAFDCTKLCKDTGYVPHFLFREGIERTVAWLRQLISVRKEQQV